MKPTFDPYKPVQTRHGRKARIVCRDIAGRQPILALVEGSGGEYPCTYSPDGSFLESCELPEDNDLVNVPEESLAVCWINVYPDGGTVTHSSASRAEDQASQGSRIACFKVELRVQGNNRSGIITPV